MKNFISEAQRCWNSIRSLLVFLFSKATRNTNVVVRTTGRIITLTSTGVVFLSLLIMMVVGNITDKMSW